MFKAINRSGQGSVHVRRGLVISAACLCAASNAVAAAPATAAMGSTVTQLAGVSCTSATACVAVGYTARGILGRTVAFVPLAEIWNGSKWRIASTPDPAHYTGSQLRGVSCTSATACVAVGFSVLGNERRARRMTAFAERWNGVKWTLQPVAKVKHAIFTQLVGVSCTSPKACTADGDSSGRTWTSLVERWNGSVWKVQPTPHPRTFIYQRDVPERRFVLVVIGVRCRGRVRHRPGVLAQI